MRDTTPRPRDQPPTLPSLDPGLTLLDSDRKATGAIHALALDRALTGDGPVYWIDSHGVARTTRLAELAPAMRVLDRIRLARAFTAHQHATLAMRVSEHVTDPTGLLVVPELDYLYRQSDLSRHRARTLRRATIRELADLATDVDLPVLVSRRPADGFSTIDDYTDTYLTCEQTRFGPRFVGENFETLVYPLPDGSYQTTLEYWAEILTARYRADVGPHESPADQPVPGVTAHR